MVGFLTKQNAESGISAKFDRDHKFFLQRIKSGEGLQNYYLENKSSGEKLVIPRELFDRFRQSINSVWTHVWSNVMYVCDSHGTYNC